MVYSVSLEILLAADPLVKESLSSLMGQWYPRRMQDETFSATEAANLSASTGEMVQLLHLENIAVKFQMLEVFPRVYFLMLVRHSPSFVVVVES